MVFSLCTVVDEQPTLPVVAAPRCSMTTSGRFGPEVAPPPTAPAVAPAAAPWSVARASVGRAKRAAAEARARIELRMVTLLMFQMLGKRDAAKPVPAPSAGAIEPHPLRLKNIDNVGVKIQGTTAHLGGGSVPPAYEI